MGKIDLDGKCIEVRKLVKEKKYGKAYDIIKKINVEKITSIIDLKAFFETYSNLNLLAPAKEMLIRIYQKNASTHVLYQLVCLEVKAGEIEDAEASYEDYIQRCKDSDDAYILRYLIDTAKHADYSVRIHSLEQLKKSNYYEEWAYELAKTYHKAGDEKKCIKECDDIILWFGEGIIVEKAKLLRSYYVNGDTSFLKKGKIKKENVENVDKKDSLLYNTTDLGKQVSDIQAFEDEAKLKKQLKEDLSLTQNVQQAIKEDLLEEQAKRAEDNGITEDTKTLSLESIQGAIHEIISNQSEEDGLIVGEWDLTEIFDSYLKNKVIFNDVKNCFQSLKEGSHLDYCFVTTENPTQNLDFVKRLAKALFKAGEVKKSQVARIKGENLNHIQLEQRVEKLRNSILLVEGVKDLYLPAVKALVKLVEELKGQVVIVFEDTRENVKIFQEEQIELLSENAYTINI